MRTVEKFQSVILLIAIILGLLLSNFSIVSNIFSQLIVPFLFLMLLALFINIPLNNLKSGFFNGRFALLSLIINFIWTPILAYLLGFIFLSYNTALWIGFIMLIVTPCTDWYLMFTELAKGNTKLSLSLLPLNLLLQLILLPIYLYLFTGITGGFNLYLLIESIVLVVVLPFILASLFKYTVNKILNIDKRDKIYSIFEDISIISLGLAVFSMFASQGSILLNNLWIILILLIPLLLFFIINFIFVRFIKITIKMPYKDYVSLTFTTLARNSPIALAIAVTSFPNNPIIALALVIAPLIELPVLTIVSQVLQFFNNK
jgi:ACR3 family arsenite efflux pump ArsB